MTTFISLGNNQGTRDMVQKLIDGVKEIEISKGAKNNI